jgi:DNA (cytosine-5)-methyltransferase 1
MPASVSPLVLSLFPGVDLLGRAFREEGFYVVQGGDVIFGGDIREEHYPPNKFDLVIGGPPCQAFSRLAHMVRHNGFEPKFGNLIPDFERVVFETQPTHGFLMENVPDAPIPSVDGYETWSALLDNRQLGEVQKRTRRWSFGARQRTPLMIDTVALERIEFKYAATGAGRVAVPVKLGGSGKRKVLKNGRTRGAGDCLQHGTQRSAAGFAAVKRLQGLPDEFDIPCFTVEAKVKAVANGVPIVMGRALARAVKEAIQ